MKTSAPEACCEGHRHRTEGNPSAAEGTKMTLNKKHLGSDFEEYLAELGVLEETRGDPPRSSITPT